MKIYKASRRKSGSLNSAFWLRGDLAFAIYYLAQLCRRRLKFSFDSDANFKGSPGCKFGKFTASLNLT